MVAHGAQGRPGLIWMSLYSAARAVTTGAAAPEASSVPHPKRGDQATNPWFRGGACRRGERWEPARHASDLARFPCKHGCSALSSSAPLTHFGVQLDAITKPEPTCKNPLFARDTEAQVVDGWPTTQGFKFGLPSAAAVGHVSVDHETGTPAACCVWPVASQALPTRAAIGWRRMATRSGSTRDDGLAHVAVGFRVGSHHSGGP